jgi:ATPase subunit of ABC transporter with duplicated ATPase domains
MQEFINKFRFNAKRASLVQSRIKALDKMDEIDEVRNNTTTNSTYHITRISNRTHRNVLSSKFLLKQSPCLKSIDQSDRVLLRRCVAYSKSHTARMLKL